MSLRFACSSFTTRSLAAWARSRAVHCRIVYSRLVHSRLVHSRLAHRLHAALQAHLHRSGLLLAALPMVVETLEDLPEETRPLYKEANGKFTLDVDGVDDMIKSATQRANNEAGKFRMQLKAWETLGPSPEEIKAQLAALQAAEAERIAQHEQAERERMAKNGEWEKLKEQMLGQHRTELSKKDEQIGQTKKALHRYLVDAAATSALAQARGSAALLLPHVRSAVTVVQEGEDYAVRVVDRAGNPRVNGKGEFLTIADLVAEMRQSEEFGRAFDATGTSGGGAPSTPSAPSGGVKVLKEAAWNALPAKERANKIAEGYTLVP